MRVLNLFNQEHLTADFLRKNPAATVPVLEVACDGKLLETIPDSLAIVKHLERGDLGGKSLIPEGKEAMAWEWVDRVRAEFQSYTITFGKVADASETSAPPGSGRAIRMLQDIAEQHPDVADAARTKLHTLKHVRRSAVSSEELQQAHEAAWRLLDALEEMLAPGQPFIFGASFSVADAFTVPMLARLQWRNHGRQIRERSRVSQYWERIQERPSYLTVFDAQCHMDGHPEDCRCK
ncbi:g6056 [Coccomyxa viridis]|uniref:G6056 protein n=1 Tax=Coccomyxa viridis TaxID=1274662 RepID=A0ABP1FUF1_9CHLO